MIKIPAAVTLSLASLSISLFLSSCAAMLMKDHGFQQTEAVEINGAKVRSAVKAMGGKGGLAFSAMFISAGTGTLDGPFIWRVEAEGQEGVHEWIRLNEARVTTEATKRSEPFPKSYLGERAKFTSLRGEEGKTFAKSQLPGKLQVFPRTDGKVKIHLNVSVHAKGRTETQWVLFEMEPESKWKNETIFFPVEIVKNFHGNPREWDW